MHVSSALRLIAGVQRAGVPLPPPPPAAHHLPPDATTPSDRPSSKSGFKKSRKCRRGRTGELHVSRLLRSIFYVCATTVHART